jgi:hypothetical protein
MENQLKQRKAIVSRKRAPRATTTARPEQVTISHPSSMFDDI